MGKERQYRNLFAQCPKKGHHLRPNSSQDTGASWSPRQKIRGGTGIPTNLKENRIVSHGRWLTYSRCILPISYVQRQSHNCLDTCGKGGRKLQLPRYIREQEESHQYHIGKQLTLYIYNRSCQLYETENLVAHTEKSGRQRASRSRTPAVDVGYAKTAKRATHSRRLDAAIHRKIARR